MDLRNSLIRLVLTASTLLLSGALAWAQSTCYQLETALVALERSGQGAAATNFQRLDAAYNQKRYELDQAVAQARAGACTGGFFSIFTRPAPNCPQLMQRVNRLQSELASIGAERQRNVFDPVSVARERSRLLRALGNNNCGPQYAAYANGGFGNQDFLQGPVEVGTYRTLCVRTCDGYFFPISFSTVRSAFQSDAQICQQMCPAARVELYVHFNPGQESEQAVSLTGQPYTSLPTAFRYRTEVDPNCTCRTGGATAASTNYYPSVDAALASLRSTRTLADDPAAVIPTPVPIPRPEFSEDPETLANRAGGLVPEPTAPLPAEAAVADLNLTGGRDVRVVGPAYYYTLAPTGPEGASRTVAR
jgi:hypothetical protein